MKPVLGPEGISWVTPSIEHGPDLARLPRAGWDGLLKPGQGAMKHGYLWAWEGVQLRGLDPRPLILGDRGEIVAATAGYFFDFDVAQLGGQLLRRLARRLRAVYPRLLLLRIYELGSPAALTDPVLCNGRISRREASRLLVEKALAEARRGRASLVIVQDFSSHDRSTTAALSELGFTPVHVAPTVVLELPFASFEEYLSAMRAPYRRRARRTFDRSRLLRVERHRSFAHLAPELARLAELVFRRAGEVKRELLTETYFRRASEDPDLTLLLLRRPDNSMASFALLLEDRPWLHFLNCGFEERAGREEGAYFRLLYEIARMAIDDGFRRVNLGLTTIPPKLDLGGEPVALSAWIRYRQPIVHRLAVLLKERMFPPFSVETRHVFSGEPSSGKPAHRREASHLSSGPPAADRPAREEGRDGAAGLTAPPALRAEPAARS